MRPCHILRGNKLSRRWHHMLFITVESKALTVSARDTDHHFVSALLIPWSLKKGVAPTIRCTSPENVYEQIVSLALPKQRLVVYTFDLYRTLKLCELHIKFPACGWELDKCYFAHNAPTSYVQVKRGKQRILVLDSQNLYPLHPTMIALSGGLHDHIPPTTTVQQKRGRQALIREVEALQRVVTDWHDLLSREDLGNPQKTLAAQALSTYRHRFMPSRIYIHNHPDAIRLERDAYIGGRCSCFKRGEYHGLFYKLDVNSMYPYVMSRELLPCRLHFYADHCPRLEGLWNWGEKYSVIARCDVAAREPRFAVRSKTGIDFPTGKIETTLAHHSLMAALESHSVTKVHAFAVYQKAPLFADYVHHFWHARKEAENTGRYGDALRYKMLLNALYGKFGQKGNERIHEAPCDPEAFEARLDFIDGELLPGQDPFFYVWRFMGREVWFREGTTEPRDSFPAIAACITDAAREYLWTLICQAGKHNVWYCDTDCVIVNEAGFNVLSERIGPQLGNLKLEGTAQDLTIWGPKDYQFGNQRVHKGISQTAIFDPERAVWQQEEKERLRGALGRQAGKGVRTRLVEKRG